MMVVVLEGLCDSPNEVNTIMHVFENKATVEIVHNR